MPHQDATSEGVPESMLLAQPLKMLDDLIQKGRGTHIELDEQKELKNRALRCILSVAGYVCQEQGDVAEQALGILQRDSELDNIRTVVACFLRLLPEPVMEWLRSRQWRRHVVHLVDLHLPHLYRDRDELARYQTHEKISYLAQLVRDHEREFQNALQALTSLDRMRNHRQHLMKVLNSNRGRVLIRPFLPGGVEAELGELYTRVESYLKRRDDAGVVDEHKRTIDTAERFAKSYMDHGTLYSRWLAESVGDRLLSLVKEDFAANPAVQPAELSVQPRDKKYPFRRKGQMVDVGFIVKNQGPGYAYDTQLQVVFEPGIKCFKSVVEIGQIAATSALLTSASLFEIPVQVIRELQEVPVLAEVSWRNFDRTKRSFMGSFTLSAQPDDIDWEKLSRSDPYSLEPVTTAQDLVGRRDLLNRLMGSLQSSNMGSSIIQGQKRVGKTSIAKALQSHLEGNGYAVVYLEGGDYVEPHADATVARLGARLCKAVQSLEPRAKHFQIPAFGEALSPLAEFLDDFLAIVPNRPLVIVLDEFDELPLDLYERGNLGDAFFLTLRSTSSRPQIGFVLVGGEKMAHIMDCQGDQLNKWTVINVDYFTLESDWADYQELVQRPVSDTLEYTEDALRALHDITAGNPYFTNLVCQCVFRTAVARRDCHVTRVEIEQGVQTVLRQTDRNAFQHFWEDGIWGTGDRARSKSVRRRRILIALSDTLTQQSPAPRAMILKNKCIDREMGPAAAEGELAEFVTRKVLVSNGDDRYRFKVRLFGEWLKRRGIEDIISTFPDLDASLRERQRAERAKVTASEIRDLIGKWPKTYKGQNISEDKVRAWLDQFGDPQEQRTMFTLLSGLRFYSEAFLRQKMAEIDGIVRRGLVWHRERGRRKRSDILVSYLDSPVKSGAYSAALYADEAKIYTGNVIEKGELADALRERNDVQALVFVDDFVGTGKQASEYLREYDSTIASIVAERDIKVVFAAVVAFVEGYRRIEKTVDCLSMSVQFNACERLDETAKCFSQNSSIFTDPTERERAKAIALDYGKKLEKNCPLGYGDLELAVVFERGCPNDSLPILWSESADPRWIPLFKRH